MKLSSLMFINPEVLRWKLLYNVLLLIFYRDICVENVFLSSLKCMVFIFYTDEYVLVKKNSTD